MCNDRREDLRREPVFELLNGDVRLSIEQDTIHIIAIDRQDHDPVELAAKTARDLAAQLKQMADKIED
jgi:hypothetical protein